MAAKPSNQVTCKPAPVAGGVRADGLQTEGSHQQLASQAGQRSASEEE